jgi:[ribosomal protein S5]-alanine N-acetyltransferase
MAIIRFTTAHLELVPGTLALIEAELSSYAELGQMLGARIPEEWPPGEYDRPAMAYFRNRLSEDSLNAGWYTWYALTRSSRPETRVLIGAGGFFGPPTADNQVEIGYSVVSSFEGRGYATELVQALVAYAFSTGRVSRIIAHTASANIGSVRVLEKAGFHLVGLGKDQGSVKYACERHASG